MLGGWVHPAECSSNLLSYYHSSIVLGSWAIKFHACDSLAALVLKAKECQERQQPTAGSGDRPRPPWGFGCNTCRLPLLQRSCRDSAVPIRGGPPKKCSAAGLVSLPVEPVRPYSLLHCGRSLLTHSSACPRARVPPVARACHTEQFTKASRSCSPWSRNDPLLTGMEHS